MRYVITYVELKLCCNIYMDLLCIHNYMNMLVNGCKHDKLQIGHMFLDMDLSIYFPYKLYSMGSQCLLYTQVCRVHKDFQNILVSNYRIQHHFALCKSHLLHKVMEYKGSASLLLALL